MLQNCLKYGALKASLPKNSTNPMENLRQFTKDSSSDVEQQQRLRSPYVLMSFTTNEHSPTLWGLYADEGRGVCLQFDFPRAPQPAELKSQTRGYHCYSTFHDDAAKEGDFELRYMYYNLSPHRFREAPKNSELEEDMAIMFHKSRMWSFEKEYRIIKKIEDASAFYDDLFYFVTPMKYLKRIILGPKFPYSPAYVKKLMTLLPEQEQPPHHPVYRAEDIEVVGSCYHETHFHIKF